MTRKKVILILSTCLLTVWALAEAPPAEPGGIPDPRSAIFPVLLYHNQKEYRTCLQDPLLIFARWDVEPPNEILGVKGSFSDEQIVRGLRKFYREWRPPENDTSRPPPQLILAQQNWGCGAGLYEPLKDLSAEFQIDVYQLYPVVTQFDPRKDHPTNNDNRLAELIKESPPSK